jgi:MoxR-like ATPase
MLVGHTGVGKSQLAEHVVRLTGAGRFSVSRFNGKQFRIDDAAEVASQFRFRDMFNGYRVLQIEEVDQVPPGTQVALLTLLDDLPSHTACIVTTNQDGREFEKRFQRRFVLCEIKPPTEDEILAMLRLHWPVVPMYRAREIATFACGSVGQALADMDNAYAEFAT